MQGVQLIPEGELEGLPAVHVTLPEHPDVDSLVQQCLRVSRSGIRALWLESTGWGNPEVDDCIARLLSDDRTHSLVVWALRSANEDQWPATPMWHVLDCSRFVATPITMPELVETILRAPFVPQPAELLLRDPAEANLVAGILDELTTRLDPSTGAWIVLTDPSDRVLDRATHAVAKSSFAWGIRVRRG